MNFLNSMIAKKKGELNNKTTSSSNKWVKRGDINKLKEMEYIKDQEEREQQRQKKIQEKIKEEELERKSSIIVEKVQEPIKEQIKPKNEPKKEISTTEGENQINEIEVGAETLDDVLKNYDQKIDNKPHFMQNQDNKKNKLIKKFESESRKNHSKSEKSRFVYLWIKKMIENWTETLERDIEIIGATNITSDLNLEKKVFQQAKQNVAPLQSELKKQKCKDDILDSLYIIVRYCMMKEYVRANDIYMQLCIGNSPWPMGVTMVGIHERSGRSKIFTSQVAHILNDETQRKYLQSIKRLISICQKVYPTDPSKSMIS